MSKRYASMREEDDDFIVPDSEVEYIGTKRRKTSNPSATKSSTRRARPRKTRSEAEELQKELMELLGNDDLEEKTKETGRNSVRSQLTRSKLKGRKNCEADSDSNDAEDAEYRSIKKTKLACHHRRAEAKKIGNRKTASKGVQSRAQWRAEQLRIEAAAELEDLQPSNAMARKPQGIVRLANAIVSDADTDDDVIMVEEEAPRGDSSNSGKSSKRKQLRRKFLKSTHTGRVAKPTPKKVPARKIPNISDDLLITMNDGGYTQNNTVDEDRPQCPPFLEVIPTDIRNMIYKCILASESDDVPLKHLPRSAGTSVGRNKRWIRSDSWAFVQTCKTVRHELLPWIHRKKNRRVQVKLTEVVAYLDQYHPALDPTQPDKRVGGCVGISWDDVPMEDSVDVLRLATIAAASPGLRLHFMIDPDMDPALESTHEITTARDIVKSYPFWSHLTTGVKEIRISSRPSNRDWKIFHRFIEVKGDITSTQQQAKDLFRLTRVMDRAGIFLKYRSRAQKCCWETVPQSDPRVTQPGIYNVVEWTDGGP
ncbi:hypothetical protein P280DRAFT_485651 [Massarina eburnea CBS 473.64]|uniref:F-box domain-containing protein n=1 Tax=Massarina eburnea CBS 473.64 TaxID=1395130 RepID=A0A6A6RG73_9PLEO|nr:hypothetical protein P280DRAFT_485651 [Massarina eburnea CBS 473.64]